jgi:plasmid stabilization system protein ParE
MRIVFTIQARADLRGIGDWIAKDNPQRARTFVRELEVRCNQLASYPARHPIIFDYPEAAVRRCLHGDYVILFDADSSSGAVLILRIVHGARDYAKLIELPGSDGESD